MEVAEEGQAADAPVAEGQVSAPEGDAKDTSAAEGNAPAPADNKPPGYYPIDFNTATPEEIKTRHDYLYRQIKDNKRTENTLREYKQIAAEQSRQIAELTGGMNTVVNHLQEKTYTDTEMQLNRTMQDAWAAGDTKVFFDTQAKIIKLEAQKEAQRQIAALRPKTQPQNQEPANNPQGSGDFTPEDRRIVSAWQGERDENGALIRPWADEKRSPEEFHDAYKEAEAVFSSARYAHLTIDQKLAEVDKRMGVSKPAARQNVLAGNLTSARKSPKVSLSPKQEQIAIRTKFGGPKAKSDAEHLEAYRKQIEATKRNGARP